MSCQTKSEKSKNKSRFYEVILKFTKTIPTQRFFGIGKRRKSRETSSFAQTVKMRPKSEPSIAVTSAKTISNQLVVASNSSRTNQAHAHDSLSLFYSERSLAPRNAVQIVSVWYISRPQVNRPTTSFEHLCSNPNLNLPLEVFLLSVQL